MADTLWLAAYIAVAAVAVLAGDLIGSRFCRLLRRKCGGGPLLHLPIWLRVGIGLVIPAVGFSTVTIGAIGIYGSRALWILTHHLEVLSLMAFFLVGILTAVYVGGFCQRR